MIAASILGWFLWGFYVRYNISFYLSKRSYFVLVPSLDVYGLLLSFKSNCSIGNLVSLIYSHLKLMQHKTIDSVLERGEKLDTLVEKSSDLSAASQVQCASKCFSHKSSIWRCMEEHTQTNSTTYWMVTQAHANSNIKNQLYAVVFNWLHSFSRFYVCILLREV